MQAYLHEIAKHPLLAKVFAGRIELGNIESNEAMEELFRQIQKKSRIDDKLQLMMGHPDLHFVLKGLVKYE